MGYNCYAIAFNGCIMENTYTTDKRKCEKRIAEYLKSDAESILKTEYLVGLKVDMNGRNVEWSYLCNHDSIVELVTLVNKYSIVEFESK